MRTVKLAFFGILLVLATENQLVAQGRITSPKEQFGHNIGDDYVLVNYAQEEAYFKKLDQESDRMTLVDIGKTAEGRTMWMAIITSPENHQKLARYKEIAGLLARAEGLSDAQARALAAEGKAVVWIDGGLHANETLGAQQVIETVYQMVSRNDPETMRFLNDVILLVACVNPDGMDLVSNWYMREKDPKKRSLAGIPRLYQKYIGHDNNRDFYMVTQPETEAINRIFYHEWYPQIVYNHHQTGPAGTVLFAPPYRDPFNYVVDPLVPTGIELVGANMHQRFVAEGKPGSTMRDAANYSAWWNGGLRTTTGFHNMIGLLTETIGNPTPIEIPFLFARQIPSSDLPFPIAPQKTWHFKQSLEYELTANRSVLDIASKHREDFLYNMYRMGKNSIERGSKDHWTVYPKRFAELKERLAKQQKVATPETNDLGSGSGAVADRPIDPKSYGELYTPALRDARGYIIPSDQTDFLTATKFVNALIKNGITVQRATSAFKVGAKQYPAGSYVIKTAQAFRPHVLDMFEPQDHPNDIPAPGAAPRPPYDSAGWTLAYQMGVQFDRILDGFDGPFEKVNGFAPVPAGSILEAKAGGGYLLNPSFVDGIVAVNRALALKEPVYWLAEPTTVDGKTFKSGTIYFPASDATFATLKKVSEEKGLSFDTVDSQPTGSALQLQPVRIGLWDKYGGSMPSGWTRWLLEQYEFPFEVVFAPALDAGNLSAKYDVLIFVDEAIPLKDKEPPSAETTRFMSRFGGGMPARLPDEYKNRLGDITLDKTVPELQKFVKDGGTLLAIGSSTSMAIHAKLPILNALVEKSEDGKERLLPRNKYFVPASILMARVDTTNPLAYGVGEQVHVFFDNSPVFKLTPQAFLKPVRPVAWFEKSPLRSGWAWGERYLEDGVAIVDADLGKGKLLLFGPEIAFRAQPHRTFKFLFNGIYYGHAKPASF